jgi:hypothetical protein
VLGSQLFAAGGNQSYPDSWAITDGPRYSGYNILTLSPEPSIKRVAGAVHSTRGRIGTHALLWLLPRDLVVGHGVKASMVVTQNPAVVPTL